MEVPAGGAGQVRSRLWEAPLPCARTLGLRNRRVARSLPGGALPAFAAADAFSPEPRSVPLAQMEPGPSPAGGEAPGR